MNAFNLPELGDGINYNEDEFNGLKRSYDLIRRLQDGQIGPEVEGLLRQNGLLRNKDIDLDVNVLRPYMGFTYRF